MKKSKKDKIPIKAVLVTSNKQMKELVEQLESWARFEKKLSEPRPKELIRTERGYSYWQ